MKRDLNLILSYTKKNGTCLEWTRCFNTDGYPRAAMDGHTNGKVHRTVWELYNKKSASGYVIRHTCDNIKCINPEHLIIGTNVDNVQDRTIRDRAKGLKQNDVIAIQQLYRNKIYTAKDLAILFQVSIRTIHYTISNRKVGT